MTSTVRITLPAKLECLREAMEFVVSFAEESGFSPGRIMEIELALEEILVNIIHYAYPKGEGDMEIACVPGGRDRFVMVIADKGIPFNIIQVADPDVCASVDERKVGGLGIYFAKKLVDNILYSREDGKNILQLTVLKTRTVDPEGFAAQRQKAKSA
jgi:serine/threonine-protein kinase RsbW